MLFTLFVSAFDEVARARALNVSRAASATSRRLSHPHIDIVPTGMLHRRAWLKAQIDWLRALGLGLAIRDALTREGVRRSPAADGLFTWPSEEPSLIGGRCLSCGAVFFPRSAEAHKPTCPGGNVEACPLPRAGTLRTFTVQHYVPPSPFVRPGKFSPFAIGAVDLGELVVIGQITGFKLEELRVGTAMEVRVAPLFSDSDGTERLTWKFGPRS